jgi:hypothetical protein
MRNTHQVAKLILLTLLLQFSAAEAQQSNKTAKHSKQVLLLDDCTPNTLMPGVHKFDDGTSMFLQGRILSANPAHAPRPEEDTGMWSDALKLGVPADGNCEYILVQVLRPLKIVNSKGEADLDAQRTIREKWGTDPVVLVWAKDFKGQIPGNKLNRPFQNYHKQTPFPVEIEVQTHAWIQGYFAPKEKARLAYPQMVADSINILE